MVMIKITNELKNKYCHIILAIVRYLIPWPGPHAMSSIHKFVVPGPIETQSSPVPIWELTMVTPVDAWTWMPSVLGLVPEAETLTPCSLTLLQPLMTMWNIWLLRDVNPIIFMFFELENPNVCTPILIKKKAHD